MTDGMGMILSVGDAVLYQEVANQTGVTATVLQVIGTDRCLIQLDGSQIDAQELLEVDSVTLTLMERPGETMTLKISPDHEPQDETQER